MSLSLKRIDSLHLKRNVFEGTQVPASSGSPLFHSFSALISDAQFLNNARIGSETRITIKLKKKNIVILNAAKNQIASFSIDAPQMQNTQRIVLDIFRLALDSIRKTPLTPPPSPPPAPSTSVTYASSNPTLKDHYYKVSHPQTYSVQSCPPLQQKTPLPTPPPLSFPQSISPSPPEKQPHTPSKNILERSKLPAMPSPQKILVSDQDSPPTTPIPIPLTRPQIQTNVPPIATTISRPVSQETSTPKTPTARGSILKPEVSLSSETSSSEVVADTTLSSQPLFPTFPQIAPNASASDQDSPPTSVLQQLTPVPIPLTPQEVSTEKAHQQLISSHPKPSTPKASFTTPKGLISLTATATDPLTTFSSKPLTPVDSREQPFPTEAILQLSEQGKKERETLIASESITQPMSISVPRRMATPPSVSPPSQKEPKPGNSWLSWFWPFGGDPEPEMQNTLLEPFREESGLFSSNFD